MNDSELKKKIIELAHLHGFELAGMARPELSEEAKENIDAYLERGLPDGMEWFSRHAELRKEPRTLLPEVKSILMLGMLYRNESYEEVVNNSELKVSRYAAGLDYHDVIKKKAKRLLQEIKKLRPETKGRITVDSAPLAEKELARMAGLGWSGRNCCLINPVHGSYFFLAGVLLNLELPVDEPLKERCGRCNLCEVSCPTGALKDGKLLVERCISYFTIERKEPIAPEFRGRSDGWIFGCDRCQEVCPYNVPVKTVQRFSSDENFSISELVSRVYRSRGDLQPTEWEELQSKTPLSRVEYEKFRDNLSSLYH